MHAQPCFLQYNFLKQIFYDDYLAFYARRNLLKSWKIRRIVLAEKIHENLYTSVLDYTVCTRSSQQKDRHGTTLI